jgi:hypothetical protein
MKTTPNETLLDQLGRVRARVQGNGHCMYSALAAQSGGKMSDWQAARRMTAEWIRIHWPLIAEDMQARGMSMESLLHQVEFFEPSAPPEHYGDEATLYITAWILHQRIVVINTLNNTNTVVLPDALPPSPETQEIVVLYNGTDHYDGTAPARANGKKRPRGPGPGAQAGRPGPKAPRNDNQSAQGKKNPRDSRVQRNNYAEQGPTQAPNVLANDPTNPDKTATLGAPTHNVAHTDMDPARANGKKRPRGPGPGAQARRIAVKLLI